MTTATVDITGFETSLEAAAQFENNFREARGIEGKAVTAEEYLQTLVTRQLEGLKEATNRIPSKQELDFAAVQGLRARQSTLNKL